MKFEANAKDNGHNLDIDYIYSTNGYDEANGITRVYNSINIKYVNELFNREDKLRIEFDSELELDMLIKKLNMLKLHFYKTQM